MTMTTNLMTSQSAVEVGGGIIKISLKTSAKLAYSFLLTYTSSSQLFCLISLITDLINKK